MPIIPKEYAGKPDKDYFDCPHCGIKRVSYEIVGSTKEVWNFPDDSKFSRWSVQHSILRCRRGECGRLTYFQTVTERESRDGACENESETIFQYPSTKVDLPDYIPQDIRRFYREAVEAYNFSLLNSASVMCRKTIYELCDKKAARGRDYREKIQNLGLDKRITDPLLNIKNIGDETVHAKGWDKETIGKAIDVLGILIDMLYVQEERIKDFTRHYSKAKQEKNKSKGEE